MTRNRVTRRNTLAALSAVGITSIAGCTQVQGYLNGEEDEGPNTEPDPEIMEVATDHTAFRQTDSFTTIYVMVANRGDLSEFRLTAEAVGNTVIYDEDEQIFSLEEGQELQTRFELFTHEGARSIDIEMVSTENEEARDSIEFVEEGNEDQIDYTVD